MSWGLFCFLLFVNDLPFIFHSSFCNKLFADDLKMYDTFNRHGDNSKFQQPLNQLQSWCNHWQLNLSVSKCASLMVRRSYSIPENQTLFIDRNNLSAVESIRDLGVTVDSQLNLSKHIQESVFKANSRVYLLLKSFKSRNINLGVCNIIVI